MAHRRIATHALVGAALLGLALPALSQTLRIAGNFPAEHSSSVAMRHFAETVASATDGEVTVDLFPAMQLGGAGENVSQVRSGAIFGTWIGTAYLSRIVPELEAISLPFLFPDRDAAFEVIDGEVGEVLAERLADKGMMALGWMELGARHVTNSTRPIETAADLEGLKIRLQPNETHIATFRALGANPVSMDIQEVYSALQQHVIDGQENPYSVIQTRNFAEVQDYISDTGHFFDFIVVVASQQAYDGLSSEHRQVVREAMAEAEAMQREAAAAEQNAALAELRERMTFTAITPEVREGLREATRGVVEQVRERAGDEMVDRVLSKVR